MNWRNDSDRDLGEYMKILNQARTYGRNTKQLFGPTLPGVSFFRHSPEPGVWGSISSSLGKSWIILFFAGLGLLLLPVQSIVAAGNADSLPTTSPILTAQLYLPQVQQNVVRAAPAACPVESARAYGTVSVIGPGLSRPAAQNPDINLAIRGYGSTQQPLQLVEIGGDTDPQAPQLGWLFADRRAPIFTEAYRVYDWDWPCGPDGCKGSQIPEPPVTLVALDSEPQESVGIPWRGPQIYNGGFIAMVLYAEPTRLTITYTREDNPAIGYLAHLEDFCVDPNLLALYTQLDAQGRQTLPALRANDLVGVAGADDLKIAIRDTGSFMDPRSRKDWWMGN